MSARAGGWLMALAAASGACTQSGPALGDAAVTVADTLADSAIPPDADTDLGTAGPGDGADTATTDLAAARNFDAAPDLDTHAAPADAATPTVDIAAADGDLIASLDTAPQLCFDAPPADTAVVADVPAPDGAGCDLKSPMLSWDVGGPPSLVVEVGVADAAGQFQPYQDGQWVPLSHGAQCGFHVWAAFRVTLPGGGTAKQEVDAKGRAYAACGLVGSSFENAASVHADSAVAGAVTNASALKPGLTVAFVDKSIAPFCGHWVHVAVEVRDPTSNAWGRGERLLRLYDGPPYPGCPPSP